MFLLVIILLLLITESAYSDIVLPKFIHGKYIIKSSEEIYLIKDDLTIEHDGILIIEPGVNIKIAQDKTIHVYGQMRALGSDKQNIWISEQVKNNPWNGIIFFPGSNNNIFQNVNLENGVIYADNSELEFIKSAFRNKDKNIELPFIYIKSSSVLMDSCLVISGEEYDGLVIENGENIIVRNSSFSNCADPLEYSYVKGGLIENNKVQNISDDAIDLNACEYIIIRNNTLFFGSDKGISIGNSNEEPSKNIIVERNVILGFSKAISVKGGSEVTVNHCTFYNDSLVFEGWQKDTGTGGGYFQIRNSIMANYLILESIDKYSSIEYEYCLSDIDKLKGNNNITADPLFYTENSYMPLSYSSPAIDKADPNSPKDPDGTRADIGASYFDQRPPKIVINEINYYSGDDFDSGDWIEIINIGDENETMENSYITLNNDTIYVFVDGVELSKNEMFVILNDSTKFYQYFQPCTYLRDKIIFNADLPKYGSLKVFDSTGKLLDAVDYSNVTPWDEKADGMGHSLELINPEYDNSKPENWEASIGMGTPCEQNSVFTNISIGEKDNNGIYFGNILVYPNPSGREFYIKVDNFSDENLKIKIFDLLGKDITFESNSVNFDNGIIVRVKLIGNISFGNYLISLSSDSINKIIIYNYSE